jgi:hypothetical protein
MRGATIVLLSALLGLAIAGCGSGSSSSTATAGSRPTRHHAPASSSTAGGAPAGGGALSAEAQSAATGDIPDNQVFLTFSNAGAGYSMSYPEGWARKGAGADVTFSDKNNLVHVLIAKGATPTPASVQAQLRALQQTYPTLKFTAPHTVGLKSGTAVKATYTTESAPNPITGKRVLLIVDRYELSHAGKRAIVDLGTPKGVDNVDAYRMMMSSFRWL